MISVSVDGYPKEIKTIKFSGGELHPKFSFGHGHTGPYNFHIHAHLTCSDDIMEMLLLVNSIRRNYVGRIKSLIASIPYVPYARQDRVCDRGEACGIQVMANLINSCEFDKVYIYDPHSDVTPALINNCVVIEQYYAPSQKIPHDRFTHIIAPDAGAVKKAMKLSRILKLPLVVCEKERDVTTGDIVGMRVPTDNILKTASTNPYVLVIDDICDGGRTFEEIGKRLSAASIDADLLVSHGIFSKGKDELEKYYKNIIAKYEWVPDPVSGTRKFISSPVLDMEPY